MSIAEKLIQIAENEQRVYDAGYAAGQSAGGGGNYDEGFEAGKQAEYDRFWDALQNYGNLTTGYIHKFSGAGWTDENFKPKYSIIPTAANNTFSNSKITNLKKIMEDRGLALDLSKVTYNQISQTFSDSEITDLGVLDVSKCTKLAYFLWRATKLVNVEKVVISREGSTKFDTTTFQGCVALENITFEGVASTDIDLHWSTKLSRESIENFMQFALDSARYHNDGFTVTLSKAAVDKAYETSEGANDGSTSEDWLYMINQDYRLHDTVLA